MIEGVYISTATRRFGFHYAWKGPLMMRAKERWRWDFDELDACDAPVWTSSIRSALLVHVFSFVCVQLYRVPHA
jgi:hypothetical protein